jgi:hypothetical protein
VSTLEEPQEGSSGISGLAIASLVLSILSIVLGPLGCVPGIIFGHMARSKARRNSNPNNAGIALAGLIIGYIFLLVLIIFVVLDSCSYLILSGTLPHH